MRGKVHFFSDGRYILQGNCHYYFSDYPQHSIKRNGSMLDIDRILKLDNTVFHCKISINLDDIPDFDYLDVDVEGAAICRKGKSKHVKFKLPRTKQDFLEFVNLGGRITVETSPQSKIIDYTKKSGCVFRAEGKQVFIEGYNKRTFVIESDTEISAIFPDMIFFADGTVKSLRKNNKNAGNHTHNDTPLELVPNNYRAQKNALVLQFVGEYEQTVRNFREACDNIDKSLRTIDGYNVSDLISKIGSYITSCEGVNSVEILSKKKQSLEKLIEMIELSKDSANWYKIQNIMDDIQYKVSVKKDVICASLLIAAGSILIGMALLCVSVVAVFTSGFSLLPGIILFAPSGFGLLALSGSSLRRAKNGIKYNNNIERVTDFFATKSALVNEGDKVNCSTLVSLTSSPVVSIQKSQ